MNWNTPYRLLALLLLLVASFLAPACSCSGDDDDDDDDVTDCDDCEILVGGQCVPDAANPACPTCDLATLNCDWCQTVNAAQCRCDGPADCPCDLTCPECKEAQYVETQGCQCVPKPGSRCGNNVVDFDELCDPPASLVPNGGCGECCDALVCQQPCFEFNAAQGRCLYKVDPPECPELDDCVCGDGEKCGSECCDDGNSNPCDGCLPTCACAEVCGCDITSCPSGTVLKNPGEPGCFCGPADCTGVTCDGNFVLVEETCACRCELACDAPKDPDGTCGQCVCPFSCTAPLKLDTATCQCKEVACPPDTCTSPRVLAADCSCVCDVGQLVCPSGFSTDAASCSCVCDPSQVACTPPYEADATTCACECPNSCTSPKVLGAGCQCICPNSCPAGQVLNSSNCACETSCTGLTCVPPEAPSITGGTCGCRCSASLLGCSAPYSSELANCECDCDPSLVSCSTNETLNLSSCTCLCNLACGAPKVADGTCSQCVCPNSCAPPLVINSATCACGPPNCTNTCTVPYVLNSSCACVCDTAQLSCPVGFVADAGTCSCLCDPSQISCPSPFVANPTLCQCECGLACPAPKVPDALCQQCVCPVSCTLPEVLDSTTCECVFGNPCPGLVCTPPLSADANGCTCQCDPALLQCLPPYGADLTACACACDPTQVTCASPYGLDTALCACECQRTCSLGTRLDVATCTCVPTNCGNGAVETGEACDDGANNGRGPAACAAAPGCCNPGWCNTNCSAVIICSQCSAFSVPLGNGDYTIPECNQ